MEETLYPRRDSDRCFNNYKGFFDRPGGSGENSVLNTVKV